MALKRLFESPRLRRLWKLERETRHMTTEASDMTETRAEAVVASAGADGAEGTQIPAENAAAGNGTQDGSSSAEPQSEPAEEASEEQPEPVPQTTGQRRKRAASQVKAGDIPIRKGIYRDFLPIKSSTGKPIYINQPGTSCAISLSRKHVYIYDGSREASDDTKKMISVNLHTGAANLGTAEPGVFRRGHTAVFIERDELLFYGGVQPDPGATVHPKYNSLAVYNTARGTWSPFPLDKTSVVPPERYGHAACLSIDKKQMFVSFGKSANTGEYLDDFWCLDLPTRRWLLVAKGALHGYYHRMLADDYQVHIFGARRKADRWAYERPHISDLKATFVYLLEDFDPAYSLTLTQEDVNEDGRLSYGGSEGDRAVFQQHFGGVRSNVPLKAASFLMAMDENRGFVLHVAYDKDVNNGVKKSRGNAGPLTLRQNRIGYFDTLSFNEQKKNWFWIHCLDSPIFDAGNKWDFAVIGKESLYLLGHAATESEEPFDPDSDATVEHRRNLVPLERIFKLYLNMDLHIVRARLERYWIPETPKYKFKS